MKTQNYTCFLIPIFHSIMKTYTIHASSFPYSIPVWERALTWYCQGAEIFAYQPASVWWWGRERRGGSECSGCPQTHHTVESWTEGFSLWCLHTHVWRGRKRIVRYSKNYYVEIETCDYFTIFVESKQCLEAGFPHSTGLATTELTMFLASLCNLMLTRETNCNNQLTCNIVIHCFHLFNVSNVDVELGIAICVDL